MKLLILDLDETLIYGTEVQLDRSPDFYSEPYYFYKRPHLDAFLTKVAQSFEVAVWTSSTAIYADAVVPKIFPSTLNLKFVWARDKCTLHYNPELGSYDWVKNLSKVKKLGYNLESVVMVDDTPNKLSKHYGNLVRVSSFEGNTDDDELSHLANYLLALESAPNIRSIEKRAWRVRK